MKNINFLLYRHELGYSLSHEALRNSIIRSNISGSNYKTSRLSGQCPILDIDVQGTLAAIVDTSLTLHLWDVELKARKLTYPLYREGDWAQVQMEKVKLIGRSLLFSFKKESLLCIRVVNLDTRTIQGGINLNDPKLPKTCIIDDKIFVLVSNEMIEQWNLQGESEARWLTQVADAPVDDFFGYNHFLVVAQSDRLIITNTKDQTVRSVDFSIFLPIREKKKIECFHLQGNIFACIARLPANSICFIVDIERGAILEQNPFPSSGTINRVVNKRDATFVADANSTIIVYNLTRKIFQNIFKSGSFSTGNAYALVIEGEILASAHDIFGNAPNIKFWDTETLELLDEISVPNCRSIRFTDNKLVCLCGMDLVILDLLQRPI